MFKQERQLFKNIFYKENRRFIKDLKLIDIIIVKGFYINIIIKVALFK
jgi:hypothetical protein